MTEIIFIVLAFCLLAVAVVQVRQKRKLYRIAKKLEWVEFEIKMIKRNERTDEKHILDLYNRVRSAGYELTNDRNLESRHD